MSEKTSDQPSSTCGCSRPFRFQEEIDNGVCVVCLLDPLAMAERFEEEHAARKAAEGRLADAYGWVRHRIDDPVTPFTGIDHGCATCMEGYQDATLVVDGFVCVPHQALLAKDAPK